MAGETDALSDLLREYAPRLRESLSIDRRWQSTLDVEDVLQVTFLEAFLKVGTFAPGGPNAFFGWLRRIAENNLRDAIKGLEAGKRPPPGVSLNTPVGDESVVALLDYLGVSTTPSRTAAVGEMQSAMEAALASLPPDYAAVIREYDLKGRDIAEVAATLGRTTGAIHMLRARAHDRLRESLGPESNFFSNTA